MRRLAVLGAANVLVAILYACGSFSGDATSSGPAGDGSVVDGAQQGAEGGSGADGGSADAGIALDSGAPRCDVSAPFTSSVALVGISTSSDDIDMSMSSDELDALFETHALPDGGPADGNAVHILQTTRTTAMGSFSGTAALSLEAVDGGDLDPWLQPDDATLYFGSTRNGTYQIFVAKRPTPSGSFVTPAVVANIAVTIDGGPANVRHPSLNANATEMFFATQGPDLIYRSLAVAGVFGAPAPVTELNALAAGKAISAPVLSHDALTIYFSISTGSGNYAIWVAQRANPESPFGDARMLTEIDQYVTQNASWLSYDQCRLYVAQQRDNASAQSDFYMYSKTP